MDLNPDMYEFYGILLGDGCISRYRYDSKEHFEIRIDGSAVTDVEYYHDHLVNLIFRIFNRRPTVGYRKQCRGIYIHFRNKDIAFLLHTLFDFPFGKKGNISIKKEVVEDFGALKHVLRGLFDTDGSLYFTKNNSEIRYYPIIEITTYSADLLTQLKTALLSAGFRVNINHRHDSVKLHGKENLLKWMELIGTSHHDKASKYEFWRKHGYCPKNSELPYTERLDALGP